MQRIFAIASVVLVALTAPTFAQTAAPAPVQGQVSVNGQPNSGGNTSDGLDAMAQDGNPSPLLIGGLAVGAAAVIIIVATRHRSTSP